MDMTTLLIILGVAYLWALGWALDHLGLFRKKFQKPGK